MCHLQCILNGMRTRYAFVSFYADIKKYFLYKKASMDWPWFKYVDSLFCIKLLKIRPLESISVQLGYITALKHRGNSLQLGYNVH